MVLRKTQFFFSPVHPLVLQHLVCRHRAAETSGEADQLTAASAGQQRPAVRLISSWQPLQGRDPSQGDGQGGLVCFVSWGGKELDMTE